MALAIFSRGTKAKLDATKKTDGRIYVTTDTGNMYVDVGNETDSSAQRFLIGADGIKAASDAVASAKSYTDTVAAGKANTAHTHKMADVTGLSDALEGVYPVGSLYLNATDATNPHDLLGFGTWAAFGQGRMLLSASDAHEAGATGGSETVALTAEQMPGHTHTATTSSAGAHTHTATTSSAGAHTHTSWYVGVFSNNDADYGNSHLDKRWNSLGNGGTTERYGRASLTAPSAGGHTHTLTTASSGAHTHTLTTASAGGGKAHNNMPPYITVYMWVRTA